MAEMLRKGCLLNVVEECYTSFAKEGRRDMLKFWDCWVQKGVIVHWAVEKTVAEKSLGKLSKESCKKFCVYVESVLLAKCQCDNSI